jgi:hypothetical protein
MKEHVKVRRNILKSLVAVIIILSLVKYDTINSKGDTLEHTAASLQESQIETTMGDNALNVNLSTNTRTLVNTNKIITGSGFSEGYQVIQFKTDFDNNFTLLSWAVDSKPIDKNSKQEYNFNDELVILSDNISSILPALYQIRTNLYDSSVGYSSYEESVMYKEYKNGSIDMKTLTQAELNYYIDYMTEKICYDIILEERYDVNGGYTFVDDNIDMYQIIDDFTDYLLHMSQLDGFNNPVA